MSRSAGALRVCAAAAGLVLLAGCGAEIVHVRNHGLSPDGPFAPPAGGAAGRPSAQPSASVNGVIHFIAGGGAPVATTSAAGQPPYTASVVPDLDRCRGTSASFPSDTTLAPNDIWPDATVGAQVGMTVMFPTGCALDQPGVPTFDCTIGFPWFTVSQTTIALADIGVVQLDMNTLIYGQQGVTEYLLHLTGYGADDLIQLATTCDEQQSNQDAAQQVFRARTTYGVTTSLLRVSDNIAVALVFHGLPENSKDNLLALAAIRAGQP